MSLADVLLEKVAAYKKQMIDTQAALVAAGGVGPDNGGEGEMQKGLLVEGWLKEMGLEVIRVDAPDDRVPGGLRPNLVATWGQGPGPTVWVLSHLDVVPAGELSLWGGDPFQLRVDGDVIYGRGVSDNHGGLVASLYALKALMESGHTPPGPVGLVLVSDEETGSQYGLDYVLKNRGDLFKPTDLVIVPDIGEPDGAFVEVAEKSILWLKVEVIGKQVHGSMPHTGVNALYASARMMVAVHEIRDQVQSEDPLFNPPMTTCEPTAKAAGVSNVNTVPGKDVFYVDCRLLPHLSADEVLALFQSRFAAIAAEEGARVDITVIQKLQAAPATPADAPVVLALAKAIEKVRGLPARVGGVGGGTVAAFFRQAGIPTACWCTEHHQAHQPDESIDLNDIVADARVMALVMAGE